MRSLLILLALLISPLSGLAQSNPQVKTSHATPALPSTKTDDVSKKQPVEEVIDWGDWDQKYKPQHRYRVGVKGKLQDAISELDKSNLLDDTSGVTKTKPLQGQSSKKSKDIKKMKEELRALERKVIQEIESDGDY